MQCRWKPSKVGREYGICKRWRQTEWVSALQPRAPRWMVISSILRSNRLVCSAANHEWTSPILGSAINMGGKPWAKKDEEKIKTEVKLMWCFRSHSHSYKHATCRACFSMSMLSSSPLCAKMIWKASTPRAWWWPTRSNWGRLTLLWYG